jgi:transposase
MSLIDPFSPDLQPVEAVRKHVGGTHLSQQTVTILVPSTLLLTY